MAFPIYLNGKILFRDGLPAFSTNCCCGECIRCQYYYYEFSIFGDVDWRAGPAPEPEGTTIYYAGQRSTDSYNTHLWLWEACEFTGQDAPYGLLGSEVDAFHDQNMAETNSGFLPLAFGLVYAYDGHGDNNYWKDSMKAAYLPDEDGYSIDESVNIVPPNWECG
jgi:hypothetical protein